MSSSGVRSAEKVGQRGADFYRFIKSHPDLGPEIAEDFLEYLRENIANN